MKIEVLFIFLTLLLFLNKTSTKLNNLFNYIFCLSNMIINESNS